MAYKVTEKEAYRDDVLIAKRDNVKDNWDFEDGMANYAMALKRYENKNPFKGVEQTDDLEPSPVVKEDHIVKDNKKAEVKPAPPILPKNKRVVARDAKRQARIEARLRRARNYK